MRLKAHRLTLTAGVSIAVLGLAACSSGGSSHQSAPALQSYSCCSSEDINAVRHPGETVQLHWIAVPAGPGYHGAVSTVRLEASLSGPFASVSKLKSSDISPTVKAPLVVTTDEAGQAPISSLAIPADAGAGSYSLTFTIDADGGQVSGGSVIQVSTAN